MFYNVPYEQLEHVRLNEIKTHSFIAKEIKLLSYVKDRSRVNVDKAEMDFKIYEKDLYERQNGRSQNKPQQIPADFPRRSFQSECTLLSLSDRQ